MNTRLVGAALTGCLLMAILLFSFKSSQSSYAADPHAELASPPQIPQSQSSHDVTPVAPLPGGCVGALPPNTPGCLSGFVYMNGEAISGAKVEVQYQSGITETIYTQVFSTKVDKLPYCILNLSSKDITSGSVITLTASFSGREQQISHTVEPGDQQVDIVLPRRNESDLILREAPWQRGPAGHLNWPLDIDVDRNNYIYVADDSNARIQVFTTDGQFIRQWGELGDLPGQFRHIRAIATDRQESVYVADYGRRRILKFYINGGFIAEHPFPQAVVTIQDFAVGQDGYLYLVSAGAQNCIGKYHFDSTVFTRWGCSDTIPLDPLLGNAYGLAVDILGNRVYVADDNSRILTFDVEGNLLDTIDIDTSFLPRKLAVDSQGDLYFIGLHRTDPLNASLNVVGKVDLPGPNPSVSYFHWCNPATGVCQIDVPWSITIDQDNILYMPERRTGNVLKLTTDGSSLSAWNTTTVLPDSAMIPRQILFGHDGSRYVLDRENSRIQIITSNGITYTVGGSGDNDGQLNNPSEIDVDNAGNIFVADRGNNRIQKLDNTGQFLEKWDNTGSSVGQPIAPQAVAISETGTITMYVADTANNQVLKLENGTFISWCPTASQHRGPIDIEFDEEGYIYILYVSSNSIQKMGSDCSVIFERGAITDTSLQLNLPSALAIQGSSLYIADAGNNRIVELDTSGNLRNTWGYSTNEPREFGGPENVSIDTNGNLYVISSVGNTVLRSQVMTYGSPVGTLTYVSNNVKSLYSNQELVAMGKGQVSGEGRTIQKYRWTTSRDIVLSETSTLRLAGSALAPGPDKIRFSVADDQGQWSKPIEFPIYVNGYPLPPPSTVTPTPTATPTSVLTPDPNSTPTNTPSPTPTATPNIDLPAQWAMFLYYVCDYDDGGDLEARCQDSVDRLVDNYQNLNRNVRIAIQMDGSGVNETKRWLLYPGKELMGPIGINEQAMDDPATLAEFVKWGLKELPTNHYYLAIINHGQAVKGIGWDKTSGPDSFLTAKQIGVALKDLRKPDVLHLDGCSMGLLDVAFDLRDQARYLISSQNLVWSYLAYWDYQKTIETNTSPEAFAKQVVDVYANRAEAENKPYTLSILDLSKAQTTNDNFQVLITALIRWIDYDKEGWAGRIDRLLELRKESQKFEFDGNYEINEIDAYVDLRDWVEHIQQSMVENTNPHGGEYPFSDTQTAAANLLSIMDDFVIESRQQTGYITQEDLGRGEPLLTNGYNPLEQSHGISIFYPWGRVEDISVPTPESYASGGSDFNQLYSSYINDGIFDFTVASQWDEFLSKVVGENLPPEQRDLPVSPLAPLNPSQKVFLPIIIR